MQPRTSAEVRAELLAKGISITEWAVSHQYAPNLVFDVLGGRKKCLRGKAHEIAVKLGLKVGEIVRATDIDYSRPAQAATRRSRTLAA